MALKPPTVMERKWMKEIGLFGCICCWMDWRIKSVPEIHHMLSGGRRISHRHTIPLCHSHHQGGRNDRDIVSRDRDPRRFEERYGTEESLRLITAELIGWKDLEWLTMPTKLH